MLALMGWNTRACVADPDMQLAALDIELWSVFFVVPTGRATGMTPLSADAVESAGALVDLLRARID